MTVKIDHLIPVFTASWPVWLSVYQSRTYLL